MKRFLIVLVVLVLCCSVPVYADGEEDQPPVDQPPAAAGESSEPVVVEVNPQINVEPTPIEVTSDGTQVDLYITFATPEPEPDAELAADVEPEPESLAVPDVHALVDLQEPGGLAQVVVSIFGEYRPRIETVTSVDDAGVETVSESIVPGLAGLDWPWLAGAVLFAIMLHGFLALIGVVLKHG